MADLYFFTIYIDKVQKPGRMWWNYVVIFLKLNSDLILCCCEMTTSLMFILSVKTSMMISVPFCFTFPLNLWFSVGEIHLSSWFFGKTILIFCRLFKIDRGRSILLWKVPSEMDYVPDMSSTNSCRKHCVCTRQTKYTHWSFKNSRYAWILYHSSRFI